MLGWDRGVIKPLSHRPRPEGRHTAGPGPSVHRSGWSHDLITCWAGKDTDLTDPESINQATP